ncbi:hypothetical protein ACX0G9_24630 [Flavitalea flava]
MTREEGPSAEQVKQRIEYYKENLRFLNSFYLPVVSGMAALYFASDTKEIGFRYGWIFNGALMVVVLTLFRQRLVNSIKKQIEKL